MHRSGSGASPAFQRRKSDEVAPAWGILGRLGSGSGLVLGKGRFVSRFKGRVFGELGTGALVLWGLAGVAAPACGETYELRAPDGAAGAGGTSSGGTSSGGSAAAGGAPSGAGAPGSAGTSGGPSDCGALPSYETPEEECWGSFVAADENGVVTLTTLAARGGEPGAGEGGAGGTSAAPSAAASGSVRACATRDRDGNASFLLRGGWLTYERPDAPYRIDVWRGDSACERGSLVASTRGDGSAAGTLDVLELPARAESRPSSNAFTVELTSTTGAELRLRFQVVVDHAAP